MENLFETIIDNVAEKITGINQDTKVYCENCKQASNYSLEPRKHNKIIDGKEFEFTITEAICNSCGNTINLSELASSNAVLIERQYKRQIGDCAFTLAELNDLKSRYTDLKLGDEIRLIAASLDIPLASLEKYFNGDIIISEDGEILRKALTDKEFRDKKINKYFDSLPITEDEKYFIDSNNNKWVKVSFLGSKLHKYEAYKKSQTLINCHDCIDCYNMQSCENCDTCHECINCIDCSLCFRCIGCISCKSCSGCRECTECKNCNDCIECVSSEFCSSLKNVKNCENMGPIKYKIWNFVRRGDKNAGHKNSK